jgi:hypothetical protein
LLLLPLRPMPLLQFYAQLLFRAAALLTAGFALVCLAVFAVLGGALPGVELDKPVARAARALHRDAGRLLASARARKAPPISRSGDAG